jgi:hypothetical protein
MANKFNIGKGIKRVSYTLLLSFGCFLCFEISLHLGSRWVYEKIEDESQLERVLNEEKEKLGIKDKVIHARFGESVFGEACCEKLKDGSYEVRLDSLGRNRADVRHELYHIWAGHLDKKGFGNFYIGKSEVGLEQFFIEEPAAIVYQALGIKLGGPSEK